MTIAGSTLPQRNDGPGLREWVLIVTLLAGIGFLLTYRVGAASVYLETERVVTNMVPVVQTERLWTLGFLPYAVQVTTINYQPAPLPNIFPPQAVSPVVLARKWKNGKGETKFNVWTVGGETYALPAYVKIKSTTGAE